MSFDNIVFRFARAGDGRALVRHAEAAAPLAPHQVRIEMRAASLNYRDLLIFKNVFGDTREGQVPLSDGAGVVVEVGSAVRHWQVGDRVAPGFFRDWIDGRFRAAYHGGALGGSSADGVLAQYVVAGEDAVVRIPDHLSDQEAATLPCAAVTVWHALAERSRLQPGDTLLVQGTGGVAVFALQMAAAIGARAIVLSSSDAKLERARGLGAWATLNYRSAPDWEHAVLALTEGQGVDHVLELGGPQTYPKSLAVLASGGSIAQIGVLTGFGPTPNLMPLQLANASIHGVYVGSAAHFTRLNGFLAEHSLHPVIDRRFPVTESAAALDYLASGQHVGKVVLDF